MAELLPTERLQPSLLDRLTDDEPEKQQESREQRVLSMRRLRQSVLRDMVWLLNAVALDSVQDLAAAPEAAHSTINFGILDLSGHHLSGSDALGIERRIRQAIMDFEPRILKETLKVKVTAADEKYTHNAMTFDIEGDLWMQPLPVRLYLKTEIDLETGNVDVTDQSA
ncbi:MAG: type secretion system lysozyme-related protein [Proteobacteria bacterium]|nr:type secretion system lysozyme-related protein [Pseudomonadota bacterium]